MSEMPKLPPTARRVAWNTSGKVNADIRGRTLKNMERAIDSGDLDGAIRRMDREWDTERVLETNAACLLLLSLGLGVAKDRRWRSEPEAVLDEIGLRLLAEDWLLEEDDPQTGEEGWARVRIREIHRDRIIVARAMEDLSATNIAKSMDLIGAIELPLPTTRLRSAS